MDIGPLEYVVIGMPNQQLAHVLFPELNAIREIGQIRVVDLIFVTKAADGAVVMREVSESEAAAYGGLADELRGLLTVQDVEQLTGQISPGTSAVVILFEHTWVTGLTEAVRKGGGVVFTGGMVPHDALARVSAELAAMEIQNA